MITDVSNLVGWMGLDEQNVDNCTAGCDYMTNNKKCSTCILRKFGSVEYVCAMPGSRSGQKELNQKDLGTSILTKRSGQKIWAGDLGRRSGVEDLGQKIWAEDRGKRSG
jgi:hypothetical protein